jgi:hypothetical protein
MSTFEFQGKTFKIVPDVMGELVVGCKQCAFYSDNEKCAEVDYVGGHTRCTTPGDFHHYEEVPAPQPA